MRVTRNTRASKNGTTITCPKCGKSEVVFHFSWSALSCPTCGAVHDKCDWLLADKSAPSNPNAGDVA